MEVSSWIAIFLAFAGILQALIAAILGVIWRKIGHLEKDDITIGKQLVALEVKLSDGIEATLQEIKTILESHGEKLRHLELASALHEGKELGQERGLQGGG